MKKNNKGFTLAELLIVVAIIAVLVAIAIPIFTSQLEKSREAVDEANARSLYAETVAAVLAEDTTAQTTLKDCDLTVTKDDTTHIVTGIATLPLSQQKDGLEGGATSVNIGGVDVSGWGPGKTLTITVLSDGTAPTIEIA